MLSADCGILPVVENGALIGVVTDRDLFIAAATRDQQPSRIKVGDVMTGQLYTCQPEDDAESVLAVMKAHGVRRVPVEGFGGTIVGLVSMNDLILGVGTKAVKAPSVIGTLQSICAHHHPAPRISAA